jgi:hypothetical protein
MRIIQRREGIAWLSYCFPLIFGTTSPKEEPMNAYILRFGKLLPLTVAGLLMLAAPGFAATCAGGPDAGKTCFSSNDCRHYCSGGPKVNQACFSSGDCGASCSGGIDAGKSCVGASSCRSTCVGGTRAGLSCIGAGDCPGGGCAASSCISNACLASTCSGAIASAGLKSIFEPESCQ